MQVERSKATVDCSQDIPESHQVEVPPSPQQKVNRILLLRILGAVLAYIIVYVFIDYIALSSFAKILVEMEVSAKPEVKTKIYYSTSSTVDAFSEKLSTDLLPLTVGQRVTHRFDLNNATIKRLRLDPGDKPGIYKIYSIELLSFFGKAIKLEPFDSQLAIRVGPNTRIAIKNDYLEIVSLGQDPYIIVDRVPNIYNPGLRFIAPLIFSVLTYVVVRRMRLSRPKIWHDVHNKKPSSGENYQALDGLRGLAALFVLADHCGLPLCDGLGMVGVVIFFSLSGFLLTMPYATNGKKAINSGYIQSYFLRRIRRVIPMYYAVVPVVYLFHHRIEDALRSALFLQGNSIYWTVLQEMHFYLMLLPVLLLSHLLLRDIKWLICVVLLLVSYGFNHEFLSTYRVYGMGQSLPLFAGIFLSGMAACYFYHIERVRNSAFLQKLCSSHLFTVLLFGAVVLIHHFCSFAHSGARCRANWVLTGNYNYLVAVLLFVLVLSNTSIVARVLNTLPLRLIGLISYSFYLLHPVVVSNIKNVSQDYFRGDLSNIEIFVISLIVTSVVSVVSYTYIERPFLKTKRVV